MALMHLLTLDATLCSIPPMAIAGALVRSGLCTAVLTLVLTSPARAGDAEKGQDLYASRCLFCHGATGKGDGPAGAALKPPPTNFTSADYWKAARIETMKDVVANGKLGTAMLAFKSSVSREQIDDVVAYLQTFKPAQ
jgi:mono/diheme cytochrome c family protein